MTLELLEAIMRKIERIEGLQSATRVYLEGYVPERTPYPQTTVQEISFRPVDSTHQGGPSKNVRLLGINCISEPRAPQSMRTALIDADLIYDTLHGQSFSITLADGRMCRIDTIFCQGGTSFRDVETKEGIVQRHYQVTHG